MTREAAQSVDDFRPAEIARLIETAGVAKARLTVVQTLVLAMLAGAFIAFGAALFTATLSGVDPVTGPYRFLGGVVFSLGLILVVVAGAELFTGNALMVIAVVDGRIKLLALLRNWGLVYVGNAVGGVGIAFLFWGGGSLDGPVAQTASSIAETKVELSPSAAFCRGVLCNMLVCIAVWVSAAARSVTGKVLVVILPIAAFVTLGLEHSVANFFFFAQGVLAGADLTLTGVAGNLFWVTLGNILGGAGGVALAYRLIWGPPEPNTTGTGT